MLNCAKVRRDCTRLFKCVVYRAQSTSLCRCCGRCIKSMRTHSDSTLNVVFQGECWYFSAPFYTLSEKIEHSAFTSRKTGERTNEMPRALSARVSTHRALHVGSDGWEQPHGSKPGASHAVRRAGRGTAAETSVGTTRRCESRAPQNV